MWGGGSVNDVKWCEFECGTRKILKGNIQENMLWITVLTWL